jgi:hypothetical protein
MHANESQPFKKTANEHDHVLEVRQDKVTELTTDFARLGMEVSALRSVATGMQKLSEEISVLKAQITEIVSDSVFATAFVRVH